MSKNLSLMAMTAFSTLLALTPVLQAQNYTVTDLGTDINPAAINNLGEVVGSISLPHSDPHAFCIKTTRRGFQSLKTEPDRSLLASVRDDRFKQLRICVWV
jgi:hypothetical protein